MVQKEGFSWLFVPHDWRPWWT